MFLEWDPQRLRAIAAALNRARGSSRRLEGKR
jgi:hypothetical protein